MHREACKALAKTSGVSIKKLPKVGEDVMEARVATTNTEKARFKFVNRVRATGKYQVVIRGHRDMHRVRCRCHMVHAFVPSLMLPYIVRLSVSIDFMCQASTWGRTKTSRRPPTS